MKSPIAIGSGICVALLLFSAPIGLAESISDDQLDAGSIYAGSPSNFSNAAEVDFQTVAAATPEYDEIQRKRIKRGTAKYWILTSEASDRAIRAVRTFARDSEYDLIAEAGYLGSLKPPIDADDVTADIVALVSE